MNSIILLISSLLALNALGAISEKASADRKHLVVASKDFTESVIIGELLTQLLENDKVEVKHLKSLGGSPLLWKALLSGEIDVFADYSGTIIKETLGKSGIKSETELASELAKYGIGVTKSLGFNNTYVIGMRADKAAKLGIKRISDLAAHPGLRFGFCIGFVDRSDGWPLLRDSYHLPQTEVSEMDHEITYRALDSGDIDATNLFSTDTENDAYGITRLEDDRQIFTDYQAIFLYRLDSAAKEPRLVPALQKLEGKIDATKMTGMNAGVKLRHLSEEEAARDFLVSLGEQVASKVTPSTRGKIKATLKQLAHETGMHLVLVFLPLLLNILVAIPLGIWSAQSQKVGHWLLAVVSVAQTIPSLALLVFLIPLLGVGFAPALAALFIYGILPIMKNTYLGLKSVPQSLRESADALGLSTWQRLKTLELPMASPTIMAGIKVAAVLNVGTATLGAIIGAGGFGESILTGVRHDDMAMLMQGAIPAALLALLIQALFTWLENRLIPRGLRLTMAS